jgi:ribosomal protein L37AE/L43A
MIDIEEIEDAINNNIGYCTNCKEFTRDCTEGDAENYNCPECKRNTVLGAETAIIMGVF